MSKTKIIVLSLLAAGAVASLLIQRNATKQTHQRESLLRQKQDELAQLIEQQRKLSNAVSRTAIPQREDHSIELANLRKIVEALRKQTNDLSKTSALPRASRNQGHGETPEQHPPEYWDELRAAQGEKSFDARNLGMAAWEYATDHKNQMPTSLDQLSPYLNKNSGSKLSGTNQFDLVFQGSIDDLQGIPTSEIAVIRDRETWTMPDGKTYRVYGMIGGVGRTVASDDNFQSWEAEHVIGSRKK